MAISGSRVQLFDISSMASPLPYTQVEVDWDIQTLFPHDQYLLVGAASGVHILDNTDPASPQYDGDFTHARALDPVVAQGDHAYVALKRDPAIAGTDIVDQMNVLDISDITQPRLPETISMQGPSGLSVNDEQLYVCDGAAGLKNFSLADPASPQFTQSIPGSTVSMSSHKERICMSSMNWVCRSTVRPVVCRYRSVPLIPSLWCTWSVNSEELTVRHTVAHRLDVL